MKLLYSILGYKQLLYYSDKFDLHEILNIMKLFENLNFFDDVITGLSDVTKNVAWLIRTPIGG